MKIGCTHHTADEVGMCGNCATAMAKENSALRAENERLAKFIACRYVHWSDGACTFCKYPGHKAFEAE